MSTVGRRLITAEEFMAMPNPPDGSRQELVRGVIETMPPPKGPHGICCSRVNRRVGGFVEDHNAGWTTCNDAGFILERGPDTVRGPDVAFWSRERVPEMPAGYFEVPPDLAVEVVSPEDHFARIQRKVLQYLDAGVRLLWVVDPEDRSVTLYRPDQKPRILGENETITGEDVLPGLSCRVAELLP
jgi:Uma2 family endonuclease